MMSMVLFLLLPILFAESFILPQSIEDYFWRDFDGLIPSDAILGGVNAKGEKVYVGQIVAGNRSESDKWDVLPAMITQGYKVASATYYKEVLNPADEATTKIMCAPDTSRYYWYSPKDAAPSNCRYVIAGLENGNPMYVGRAKADDGSTVIGKYFSDDRFTDLIAPYKGVESFYSTYEILTYCTNNYLTIFMNM